MYAWSCSKNSTSSIETVSFADSQHCSTLHHWAAIVLLEMVFAYCDTCQDFAGLKIRRKCAHGSVQRNLGVKTFGILIFRMFSKIRNLQYAHHADNNLQPDLPRGCTFAIQKPTSRVMLQTLPVLQRSFSWNHGRVCNVVFQAVALKQYLKKNDVCTPLCCC